MSKSINWPLYNRSLVNRGKITFWFSEEITESWWAKPNGKPGAQPIYSDSAIEAISILRFRFSLDLRATQGFAESIIELMNLAVDVPDYSTLCRRLQRISPKIKRILPGKGDIHIVINWTQSLWRGRMESSSTWVLKKKNLEKIALGS